MGRRLLSARYDCEDNRAKRQAVTFLAEPCCVLMILTMTPRRVTTTHPIRSTMATPLGHNEWRRPPHHVVARERWYMDGLPDQLLCYPI